jgi:hypothetical protein
MDNHVENLNEPLADDPSTDSIAHAVKIFEKKGINLYAVIPELKYLLHVESKYGVWSPDPEELEDYNEEMEEVMEMIELNGWGDRICIPGACKHPHHY